MDKDIEWIKEEFARLGWSQAEAARRTGYSLSAVESMAQGRRSITRRFRIALALAGGGIAQTAAEEPANE